MRTEDRISIGSKQKSGEWLDFDQKTKQTPNSESVREQAAQRPTPDIEHRNSPDHVPWTIARTPASNRSISSGVV